MAAQDNVSAAMSWGRWHQAAIRIHRVFASEDVRKNPLAAGNCPACLRV